MPLPPVKETFEKGYATLFELATSEDIYLINFYAGPYKLEGVPKELLRDLLVGVGKNILGIMFGGCLVLLTVDVAVKNFGYLRPASVPRIGWLVTGAGTRVYDLRRDIHGITIYGDTEWTQVNFDKDAKEFRAVVVQHGHPSADNFPLYK